MLEQDAIIGLDDPILITGASGFIGSKVVEGLLSHGFRNLRCLVRPASQLQRLNQIIHRHVTAQIEVVQGNLLSSDDCRKMVRDVTLIYHLAAARGVKSIPDAFLNSVVTTKNLLQAAAPVQALKRFVNISSFAVYSNWNLRAGGRLDESCEMERTPHLRGDAYCYAKVKQDELVIAVCRKENIPFVIVRPGVVYGPGNMKLPGRIGIGSFGLYLHLGGANKIPFTYIDNCAQAIILAGLKKGVEGEIFNVVDDDLPSSRHFLKLYKEQVDDFRSLYLPHAVSYLLCYLWEKYSQWSDGQLPPVYNRRAWSSAWKGNTYSNEKIKQRLGWKMTINFEQAVRRDFAMLKRMEP